VFHQSCLLKNFPFLKIMWLEVNFGITELSDTGFSVMKMRSEHTLVITLNKMYLMVHHYFSRQSYWRIVLCVLGAIVYSVTNISLFHTSVQPSPTFTFMYVSANNASDTALHKNTSAVSNHRWSNKVWVPFVNLLWPYLTPLTFCSTVIVAVQWLATYKIIF
jgi:hypothetical protein